MIYIDPEMFEAWKTNSISLRNANIYQQLHFCKTCRNVQEARSVLGIKEVPVKWQ